jgi:Zn-dependent protease
MTLASQIQLSPVLRSTRRPGHPGVLLQLEATGQVFLVGDCEWQILQSFDGSPLHAIHQNLNAQHAFTFFDGELEAFIQRSHRSGLLTIDGAVAAASEARTGREWTLALGNPERLISWLAPPARILFHPFLLVCASAALVWSWWFWATGFGASIDSPDQSLSFSARALVVLAVALMVAIVHEFAHALTLHRFGGRVREMGLTTVALVPSLYCDITDSYLLPRKRQRIAVALAGPFAQAVVGALASIWLCLAPPSHAVLHFALVCAAVAGLLSIANLFPFARTDGYYVLTEVLDLPNLRRLARNRVKSWLTGVPLAPGRARVSTWAFWLYGVPSTTFGVWMVARLVRALARPWLPMVIGFLIATSVPVTAGPVRGQVVDQQGRPLSGAVVSAVDRTTGRETAPAISDIQGEFVLHIPGDWPPTDVQATAAGTATVIAARAVPATEAADLGVVRLTPGRVVEGVVRDEQGLPVAGAEVLVHPSETGELLAAGRAISDSAGRFVVSNAPARVRSMAVRAAGFADQVSAGLRGSWALDRGGSIEGSVVAEDGTPVPGAIVQVGDRQTTTDERGQFRHLTLTPGDTVLLARTPTGSIVGSARVVVVSGLVRSITIRARRSAAIAGRVTDQLTGRAVAGALIHIYQGTSFTLSPTTVSFASSSDGNGRFTLNGMLPGLYTVEAARLGYTRSARPEVRLAAGSDAAIAISLVPEARIAGRVVDDRGQPIAGATIVAMHPNPLEQVARVLRAGRAQTNTAVSDATGRFVLRGLAAGRGLRLEATAPEYGSARFGGVDVEAGAVRSDIVFTLHRGLPLAGLVVDTGGRPIVGAAVRYARLEETTGMPLQLPMQERPPVAAHTDANGQFVISGLEAGRYDFGISASGYSTVYLRGRQVWPSSASALPRVVLPESVAISGHLLSSTGEPVVGARVSDVDLTRGIRSTTTDAAGAFVVDDLSEGQLVSLQFELAGYSTMSRAVRAPVENLTVQMIPDASLRGRAVHADTGSPITEFSVERLSRVPGQTTLRFGSSTAVQFRSDDGRFEMEGLPAGPATIRVRAAGFRPAEMTSLVLPMNDDLVVAMKPGVTVAGRILGQASRRPVPNAVISWREGQTPDPAEEMMLSLGLGERTTMSDAGGEFLLTDLPPSLVTLSVSHQEHPSVRRAVDAARERRVEIMLGGGAEVTGIVMAETSGPVEDATVTLTGAGEQTSREAPQSAVTDGSGRFRFPHVRPASYMIEARAASGVAPRQPLNVTEADRSVDVTLTMSSGTTIRGTVSGLRPELLNHIQVMAHSTGYFDSTFTDASGNFTLPHVPPGVVSVEATTSFRDGASVSARVEIPPASAGGTLDVELVFSGQSSANGVVSRGGRPVAGVIVSYSPQDASIPTRGRATTDTQGHYEVTGLSDGRYVVLVTGEGVRYQRQAVVASTSTVDIDLPMAGLQGVVTSGDGDPVEGVTVVAVSGRERGSTDVRQAVSDSSGRYQLLDLDSGHYRVRATKIGFEERLASASVNDSVVQLDLAMISKAGLRLRFTDAVSGAPMSQANLIVLGTDGGLAFHTTLALDPNGQGQIPSLSPGKYVLTAHVTGYAPRTLAVSLPAAQLQIALDHGGSVELRCCGGQSFRRVRLVDSQGLAQLVPSSTIGGWTDVGAPAARWSNVAAGRYVLEVAGGDAIELTVTAGATTVVELR